ncbi:MAG: cytochrome [Pseudonocardiales bacterium]|nr:cytochrome [Pseudonocardiales bacterium]
MTLNLAAPDLLADPYPFFDAARADGDVQWHEELGMFLAVSHAAANAVLRTRTLGRVWTPRWPDEPMPGFELIHVNSLLENEPPVHTRLRRLVASAFARGHVERLRPRVAELASGLADDLSAQDGPVDLIEIYAEPLPVQVIAELLGVPEADRHHLRPWSNAIVKMYEYAVSPQQRAEAEAASTEFVEYLRELVAQRRTEPGPDLISSLIVESDADGARLSEDELITTCTLLLNAGHEATVNVVGNGMLALLNYPDQLERLRADPSLIPGAVEELIRFDAPLQLFERTALADTTIGDVTIPAGTKIAALLGSANHDPAVFTDPSRLDVGRTDNPHLGFGAGIHFCVGAPLARVELQVSLTTLLTRFAKIELAGPAERRPEFVIRGLQRLPVAIT